MKNPLSLATLCAVLLSMTATPVLADAKDHVGMDPSAEKHTNMAPAVSNAHKHMNHVATSRKGTPDGRGYLPVAMDEAKIAIIHAGKALNSPYKLNKIKAHTRHVMHAIDPSVQNDGPGLGFGVKQAAMGIVTHIGNAAKSMDASANIKDHAPGVAAGAQNAIERSDKLLAHAQSVLKSSNPTAAMDHAKEVLKIAKEIVDGDMGMPGLASSADHLHAMQRGEEG